MWRVEENKDIRELNPGIDSLNVFHKLSDRNLKYIYYVYDWTSPMYKIDLKSKKDMAARAAGFLLEKNGGLDKNARAVIKNKNGIVNAGILKFVELQRLSDQDKALLDSLQHQINEITVTMGEPSKDVRELKDKVAITKLLQSLVKQRKEIASMLDLRITDAEEEAEREIERDMSALDKYNVSIQNQNISE